MVELVKAMCRDPRVLIIDEAEAALSMQGIQLLFSMIREAKEQGAAVLYITHRLEDIFDLCDSVTVMKDGKQVTTMPIADTNVDEVASLMVGRELESDYFRGATESSVTDEVALCVENLTAQGTFHDLSFEVCKGEILGVASLVGAGAEQLSRTLFGDHHIDHGTIWCNGEKLVKLTPAKAMKHSISYVPKERDREGVILRFSVKRNISLPILGRLVRHGFLDLPEEERIERLSIEGLDIKTRSPETYALNLSGGNRQKVVLAKWLRTEPRIFIMSNPTRGVDVATKAEIHHLMERLAAEGVAIILFSEELTELLGMSDRILVMREGSFSHEFLRADNPTEEQLIQYMV